MIIKYAIALAVVLVVAAFATWAFLPARHLPGNRARHLRIRLHLRLHPGKGFAHALQPAPALGPLRGAAPLRPDPPRRCRCATGSWTRASTRCFLGRAHYRHGLRVPLEEHLLVMARRGRSRRRSWPTSSCATPARSSPPPPNPTCSS